MTDERAYHSNQGSPETNREDALERLERGNRVYAAAHPARDPADVSFFTQAPFAVVLGCSDARMPVEQVFNQDANRLFVVRLAGNMLTPETLSSLEFAVGSLESVQLAAVLGHTGCGALTAAAAVYLNPGTLNPPLRALVDHLWIPVRLAAQALEQEYRLDWKDYGLVGPALIDLAAAVHAAKTAANLQSKLSELKKGFPVVYGIYNMKIRQVGTPAPRNSGVDWLAGLRPPPSNQDQLEALLTGWASSAYIRSMLEQTV